MNSHHISRLDKREIEILNINDLSNLGLMQLDRLISLICDHKESNPEDGWLTRLEFVTRISFILKSGVTLAEFAEMQECMQYKCVYYLDKTLLLIKHDIKLSKLDQLDENQYLELLNKLDDAEQADFRDIETFIDVNIAANLQGNQIELDKVTPSKYNNSIAKLTEKELRYLRDKFALDELISIPDQPLEQLVTRIIKNRQPVQFAFLVGEISKYLDAVVHVVKHNRCMSFTEFAELDDNRHDLIIKLSREYASCSRYLEEGKLNQLSNSQLESLLLSLTDNHKCKKRVLISPDKITIAALQQDVDDMLKEKSLTSNDQANIVMNGEHIDTGDLTLVSGGDVSIENTVVSKGGIFAQGKQSRVIGCTAEGNISNIAIGDNVSEDLLDATRIFTALLNK